MELDKKVNGITLHYEMCGEGKPILLLHGNSEKHTIFDQIIPLLSKDFTVYAIDSRGHGKSSKVKEVHYQDMADDIVELIKELHLEKPILYGFSDGGIIGLLVASQHPELLSKLIISGANTTPDGMKRKFDVIFRGLYFLTRDCRLKMMLEEPHISNEELQKITVSTLVLAGSNDMIKDEHTKNIAANIPNSVLRILNGEGHTSYVTHKAKLYEIIKPFILYSKTE